MLERIQETAAYLKGKMHTHPETAIILDDLQVFLAEVMVVAELQQIDAGGVGFHFFHQWGGRGDARNE